MNPNAIVFWAICGIVGYLLNGWNGVLYGLLAGFAISLLASLR